MPDPTPAPPTPPPSGPPPAAATGPALPPGGHVVPTWRERIELLVGADARPSRGAIAGAAAAVVAALVAFVLLKPEPPPPPEIALPVATAASSSTSTTAAEAVVHVAGAVARPGVYRLPPGARVADAVEAAGGPAPGAELHRLNLAAALVDGSQVYVPLEGERPPAVESAAGGGAEAPAGPLDLNAATAAQLEELPGIGPATAAAIVEAREERGGFSSVDDLLDVRGIGPAKLEALRDLVTVS